MIANSDGVASSRLGAASMIDQPPLRTDDPQRFHLLRISAPMPASDHLRKRLVDGVIDRRAALARRPRSNGRGDRLAQREKLTQRD